MIKILKCKNCQSSKIKTRTNYPHGRKSSSVTSAICLDCGSAKVETSQNQNRRFRKRR